MKHLNVSSQSKRQVIDVTEEVSGSISTNREGFVVVFTQHTTAAVTIMDLDPGTDEDFMDFLAGLIPDKQWRHPHDPEHAPDHLLASLIGPSVSVPVVAGKMQLGTWQQIVLIELDGPKERGIIVAG